MVNLAGEEPPKGGGQKCAQSPGWSLTKMSPSTGNSFRTGTQTEDCPCPFLVEDRAAESEVSMNWVLFMLY